MEKEKVDKLRQDMINELYSHTELGNGAIYEIVNKILSKNNL